MQDISPQKATEEELREAHDSLELVVRDRTRELAESVKRFEAEIVAREEIARQLEEFAYHDALTGLPSLRLGLDCIAAAIAEARRNNLPYSVMFLDLDGFKAINDNHVHRYGDEVLNAVANRILEEVRETDTVARIGGDEFLVILARIRGRDVVSRIAANLVECIGVPIDVDGYQLQVTASVGIALYPEHGKDADSLIKCAEQAMYIVKREGENEFRFAGT